MKTAILQMPIEFGNILENIDTFHTMLEKAMVNRPDVILLPECWTTGFYPTPLTDYADTDGSITRGVLQKAAMKYQVNIVGGSTPTLRNGNVYNTCFVFDRMGQQVAAYDKIHLFSPSGENNEFTPGEDIVKFELDSIKCGIIICYDLRFPELTRRLALEGISVLFVPAAWPIDRIAHWDALLRARAIENQIFVVAANGICPPQVPTMHLGGNSTIIDPWGEIIAKGTYYRADGEIIQANLRTAIQLDIRESIPVFKDRRPELYI